MTKSKEIVYSALVAALYCVLTVFLAPISFGAIQFRLSEALTLLAVLSPSYIAGLSLGCALSNAIGFMMGANILGAFDILFGTLATFLAAVCSYLFKNVRFKGLPLISALFPAIFNGIIIGGEICIVLLNEFSLPVFLIQALYVAVPELIICMTLGLYIVKFAEKRRN